MNFFIFTDHAKKKFEKTTKKTQARVRQKLNELKNHPDIFMLLKKLHENEPASHRLRIGSHRLILHLHSQKRDGLVFWVLDIGDRKEIYR